LRLASQAGDARRHIFAAMKLLMTGWRNGELGLACLRVAALVLSIAASTTVLAREPVGQRLTTSAPPKPLSLHWIQRNREQELQDRVAVAGHVAPHLRWLSSALWLESARPGFSMDVDPADAVIVLKYRFKF